ncbi:MAG: RDD family protein [Candidatus Nanohaloarchaea archaeon]
MADRALASIGDRTEAFLIDTGIVLFLPAVLMAMLSLAAVWIGGTVLAQSTITVMAVAVTGLTAAYFPVFEGLHGQTPGKMSADIEVVTTGGGDCGWAAAVIRNLLRAVDHLPGPLLPLVGLASIRITDRNQRIGDLAAGTVVVAAGTGEGSRSV